MKRLFLSIVITISVGSNHAFSHVPTNFARSSVSIPPIAKPFGLSMAESSLQENDERQPKFPMPRWDVDSNAVINNVLLIGAAALVLTKITLIDSDVSRGWSAVEVAQHIPLSLWNSYSHILQDSPIATKAVTSASVYTIGDIIAQRTSDGRAIGEIDRMRTLRSLLAGLIGHGPLSHLWYNFSENIFDNVLHWTAWWSILPKVAVDQTVWGPIWNNTYLILLGLMKRESLSTIWGDVKRTTIPLVVSGLKLWPLAHCVTYGLVPVENRLLWVDMVEIIWVTILASSAAGTSDVAAPLQEDRATPLQ